MGSSPGPDDDHHALIGDIRKSRLLKDRAAEQRNLVDLLDQANRSFRPHIHTPLELTGGDEFKGLFQNGEQAFRCAIRLARGSRVPLRFGLGKGPLEVGTRGDPVGRLDGPCFHNARKAIEQARDKDHWLAIQAYEDETCPAFDALINAALALYGKITEDWTPKQSEYIRLIESGMNQTTTADHAGVAASTVNQALKAARWHEIHRLENEIARQLALREETP